MNDGIVRYYDPVVGTHWKNTENGKFYKVALVGLGRGQHLNDRPLIGIKSLDSDASWVLPLKDFRLGPYKQATIEKVVFDAGVDVMGNAFGARVYGDTVYMPQALNVSNDLDLSKPEEFLSFIHEWTSEYLSDLEPSWYWNINTLYLAQEQLCELFQFHGVQWDYTGWHNSPKFGSTTIRATP